MITTDALRKALEALITAVDHEAYGAALANARSVLDTLSQQAAQEPQPVAEITGDMWHTRIEWISSTRLKDMEHGTKLYAAAPAKPAEEPRLVERKGDCLLCGHCAATGQKIAKPAEQEKADQVNDAVELVRAFNAWNPQQAPFTAERDEFLVLKSLLERAQQSICDAKRFACLFSEADKTEFLHTYAVGMREGWSMDQWRTAIDGARSHKGAQEGEKA